MGFKLREKNNWSGTKVQRQLFFEMQRRNALILDVLGDVQHSPWEIRLISTPRLHALLHFHLVPINLIISQET